MGNVRRGLRRLGACLGIPLFVASALVTMSAVPAQAALALEGTFRIVPDGPIQRCIEVQNSGTADRTPIVVGTCDGAANEVWKIVRDTGRNVLWIQAYNGAFPLNKCMDAPDNQVEMHIFGCHGGHEQRWRLTIDTTIGQQIHQADNNNWCITARPGDARVVKIGCNFAPNWRLVRA